MQRDKALHIAAGALAGVAIVGLDFVARNYGLPLAVFAGAALLGGAHEKLQQIRDEGVPSWADAGATTVGGAGVAILLHALKMP